MTELQGTEGSLALTPVFATSKIPVLVLITGYCCKKIPSKIIPPILSTLVQLIENHAFDNGEEKDLITLFFPSLNEVLALIEDSITLFSRTTQDSEESISEGIETVHRYLLDALFQINSLDTFQDFLMNSSRLLSDPPVHRKYETAGLRQKPSKLLRSTSFLGRLVHNISLAADVMMFDEMVVLWRGFQHYRDEARDKWIQLNSNGRPTFVSKKVPIIDEQSEKDVELQQLILRNSGLATPLQENSTKVQVISQVDLAEMLEYQIQMLQKFAPPPSKSMKSVLQLMSKSQRGVIPSVYYIEYLECWKQGDYEGSFNALHRYFDYMMSNRQQLFYHYALLSLATLHASFGSDDEALRAIDEAIVVARENKDLDCLNYLLTWLFNFLKDRPHLYGKVNNQLTKSQILHFLKIKTKENKNWILQSMAYQYQALQYMMDGASLTKVLENITRASYIILSFDIGTDVCTTFIRNCQLSIANWGRTGVPALSKLYIDVALDPPGAKISTFDEVAVQMRLAIIKYEEGEIEEAFKLFQSYESLVKDDVSLLKIWQARLMLLKIDLWLKKCRYRPAAIFLGKMESQIKETCDQDLYYEFRYKQALYESQVGNCDKAISIVSENIHKLNKDDNSYNHFWFIEFQILYASFLVKSSSAPERALSIVIKVLKLARRSSSLALFVKACLVLAELLPKVDPARSCDDVEGILYQVMPHANQIGNISLISYGYYLLAKVLSMKLINDEKNYADDEMKVRFNRILEYLEMSIVGFKKMNDLKMMQLSFDIEKQLAEFSKHEELLNHSLQAIHQLDIRMQEESSYSVC
ncbi:hypothetical protein CANARDRAFT_26772 [[Candida] arabinofermentans NRRL YB-2248]|nr:hypothetical protein CANARDRAFT_26772 [[Candida] arabinofermentans NRRL YB-2248]